MLEELAPIVVLPLNVLVPLTVKFPEAVKLVVLIAVALTFVTYKLAHFKLLEPKSYELFVLGIILLATSASKVTVSVV